MTEYKDWVQVFRDHRVLSFIEEETRRGKTRLEKEREVIQRTSRNRIRRLMNTGFPEVTNLLKSLLDRRLVEERGFVGKVPGDRMTYYLITEKGRAHLKAMASGVNLLSRVIDTLKEDLKSL